MIPKREIQQRAEEWHLAPEVVEKDYVLGWLLAAIGADEEVSGHWVFKGGTCLKKCYLETYRFSEDLDFSLRPEAGYNESKLRGILGRIAESAAGMSGIGFDVDGLIVRPHGHQSGRETFEVRLGYAGPLGLPGPPKVKFDLTRHEAIVLPSERRAVYHAYPDPLPSGTLVPCYPLAEVLAEKLRALVERTRPRDLYDVVYVLENHADGIDLTAVRSVLVRKCSAKNLPVPTSGGLVEMVRGSAELASEWDNMLRHQLPALPPIEDVAVRLAGLVGWLDLTVREVPVRVPLPSAALGRPAALATSRGGRFWNVGAPLEVIRFAGANRLLVSFNYHGKHRLVEPYSLRVPGTGNLMFYGWELQGNSIKQFNVREITEVEVTNRTFIPRYRVEFFA